MTIIAASQSSDLEAVKTLILKGADVNEIDAEHNTSLNWAIANNDTPMLDFLLRAGASVHQEASPLPHTGGEQEDEDTGQMWPEAITWPTIISAAYGGRWAMVRRLVEAGANYKRWIYDTADVAGQAIKQNKLEELKYLLDLQLKVNMRRRGGNTYLMDAVWEKNPEAVAMLLRHGASPFVDDRDERMPAFVDLQYGDMGLCKSIMSHKWSERRGWWRELLRDHDPRRGYLDNLLRRVEDKQIGLEEIDFIVEKMMEFRGDSEIEDALESGLRSVVSGFRQEVNIPLLERLVKLGVKLNLSNPRLKGSVSSVQELLNTNGEAAKLLRQALLNE